MPELPEIETVRMQLEKVLPGLVLSGVEVLHAKSVFGAGDQARGKKVLEVRRKGKVLVIDLAGGISIAMHFKMTGQLVFEKNSKLQINSKNANRVAGGHPTEDFTGPLPSRHTRAIFNFSDGSRMYFNDQRLFGWVKMGKRLEIEKEKFMKNLGPEPFEISSDKFCELIGRAKRAIKLVLMDQTVISGVGNIYANDALWEARVDPGRKANTLSPKQYRDLYDGVVRVLKEGIKYGGATASDAKYIDLHGLGGQYQEHFRVYDRAGKKCLREDGGIISKIVLSGRGTYFCPKCQK